MQGEVVKLVRGVQVGCFVWLEVTHVEGLEGVPVLEGEVEELRQSGRAGLASGAGGGWAGRAENESTWSERWRTN